jgi:hypothetical protein
MSRLFVVIGLAITLIGGSSVIETKGARKVSFNPTVSVRLIPTRGELKQDKQAEEVALAVTAQPYTAPSGNNWELIPFPGSTKDEVETGKSSRPSRSRTNSYFDEADFEILGGSLTNHLNESTEPLASIDDEDVDAFLDILKDLGCAFYGHLSDRLRSAKDTALRSARAKARDGLKNAFSAFCKRVVGYELTPVDHSRISEILESGQAVPRCIEFIHSICVASTPAPSTP